MYVHTFGAVVEWGVGFARTRGRQEESGNRAWRDPPRMQVGLRTEHGRCPGSNRTVNADPRDLHEALMRSSLLFDSWIPDG